MKKVAIITRPEEDFEGSMSKELEARARAEYGEDLIVRRPADEPLSPSPQDEGLEEYLAYILLSMNGCDAVYMHLNGLGENGVNWHLKVHASEMRDMGTIGELIIADEEEAA